MKKILITGSSGYIGQHLVQLLSSEYQITGLDISKKSMNKFYHLDITHPFSIAQEFDTVIHLAALVNVGDSVNDPINYYYTNIIGTLSVLENISFNNFIFASTGTASQPTCPYALSKRCAEDIVEKYCVDNNKTFTTFRFYNVIGSEGFQPTNPDGLFFNLIKAVDTGTFNLYGDDYSTPDGTCVRDYVHVMEICESIKMAIENPSNKLENLGHGVGLTVKEIISLFKETNGVDFNVNVLSRRPGDLEKTVLDNVSPYMQKIYSMKDLLKYGTT